MQPEPANSVNVVRIILPSAAFWRILLVSADYAPTNKIIFSLGLFLIKEGKEDSMGDVGELVIEGL